MLQLTGVDPLQQLGVKRKRKLNPAAVAATWPAGVPLPTNQGIEARRSSPTFKLPASYSRRRVTTQVADRPTKRHAEPSI